MPRCCSGTPVSRRRPESTTQSTTVITTDQRPSERKPIMTTACTYTTPVGSLAVLTDRPPASDTDSPATIIAAGFCSADELWDRLPATRTPLTEVSDLGPLQQPILDYLAGDLTAADQLPLAQEGTELQHEVWNGLRTIPAGETRTYGELAKTTSSPGAVRAVGTACGKNLIAPFVPCHRVVRSDGSLGGYRYNLDAKRWLLARETEAMTAPSS